MKSHRRIASVAAVLVAGLLLTGCGSGSGGATTSPVSESSDAARFKQAYEALNGTINPSNGAEYMTIAIPEDNPIVFSSYADITAALDGSAVILFGFPECPWCRNAIPVFFDVAKELGVTEVLYLNNLADRDTRTLGEDGTVVVEQEGTAEYYALLDRLGTAGTSEYSGLDDPGIRRIYFPTVVFVKNGTIVGQHVSTVDSQEDPLVPLTAAQRDELKGIYRDLFAKVGDAVCDADASC